MKLYVLSLFTRKKVVLLLTTLFVTGCVGLSDQRLSQQFRVTSDTAQTVEVFRDGRLSLSSSTGEQDCPTVFYINNERVGRYAIYQHDVFYLEPDIYTFRAKNCNGKSAPNSLDVIISPSNEARHFVLSLDGHGQPLLIEN